MCVYTYSLEIAYANKLKDNIRTKALDSWMDRQKLASGKISTKSRALTKPPTPSPNRLFLYQHMLRSCLISLRAWNHSMKAEKGILLKESLH